MERGNVDYWFPGDGETEDDARQEQSRTGDLSVLARKAVEAYCHRNVEYGELFSDGVLITLRLGGLTETYRVFGSQSIDFRARKEP